MIEAEFNGEGTYNSSYSWDGTSDNSSYSYSQEGSIEGKLIQ